MDAREKEFRNFMGKTAHLERKQRANNSKRLINYSLKYLASYIEGFTKGKHYSYPLTVEDRKTRYGPSKDFTTGSGIAAASSTTNNSTCESFSCSCGSIY